MHRGMLTLTLAEIEYLLELVSAETAATTQLIKQKLLAAHHAITDSTQLELSEEESNQLLDLLPPPNIARPEASSCRQQLTAFLQQLHG